MLKRGLVCLLTQLQRLSIAHVFSSTGSDVVASLCLRRGCLHSLPPISLLYTLHSPAIVVWVHYSLLSTNLEICLHSSPQLIRVNGKIRFEKFKVQKLFLFDFICFWKYCFFVPMTNKFAQIYSKLVTLQLFLEKMNNSNISKKVQKRQ